MAMLQVASLGPSLVTALASCLDHATPKISSFALASQLMPLENSVILRGLLPDNGLWFAQSEAAQTASITR
jgi:hypothetical protein